MMYEVFNFEPSGGRSNYEIQRVAKFIPRDHDLRAPLVVNTDTFVEIYERTTVDAGIEKRSEVYNTCEDFNNIFDDSSQKVSTGR